ncbi:hypothetical protein GIB67_003753 [Kingdonia uniflora]|uniref:RNase H type-1 domain-containing protein n=1 Tax=Kingdonia uniflora TaxID=39325 RepID=A0A7J7MSL1_9MAGN|nr:hypothetical protein GIB67_003753 [Kingdonia uniflora]
MDCILFLCAANNNGFGDSNCVDGSFEGGHGYGGRGRGRGRGRGFRGRGRGGYGSGDMNQEFGRGRGGYAGGEMNQEYGRGRGGYGGGDMNQEYRRGGRGYDGGDINHESAGYNNYGGSEALPAPGRGQRHTTAPLPSKTTPRPQHISLPLPAVEEGWHIVTVDGAWSNIDSQGGSGFVIKTHASSIIGTGYDSSRAADPEEAEAISVIRGMKAACSLGLEQVMVLTDCRRLVSAFETGSDDLSWGTLTPALDMIAIASSFSAFRFCHFSRLCNYEAHALAAKGVHPLRFRF